MLVLAGCAVPSDSANTPPATGVISPANPVGLWAYDLAGIQAYADRMASEVRAAGIDSGGADAEANAEMLKVVRLRLRADGTYTLSMMRSGMGPRGTWSARPSASSSAEGAATERRISLSSDPAMLGAAGVPDLILKDGKLVYDMDRMAALADAAHTDEADRAKGMEFAALMPAMIRISSDPEAGSTITAANVPALNESALIGNWIPDEVAMRALHAGEKDFDNPASRAVQMLTFQMMMGNMTFKPGGVGTAAGRPLKWSIEDGKLNLHDGGMFRLENSRLVNDGKMVMMKIAE